MSSLIIAEVRDKEFQFMALEITMGDAWYFIAADQDFWPGIRKGTFPRLSDGSEFERFFVTAYRLNQKAAGGNGGKE